jgi:hypothetical protein
MIATSRHLLKRPLVSDRDMRLQAAARDALAQSPYTPLRQLNCQVVSGVIELTGTVGTFYLKQLAQVAMMRLDPSGSVRNLIQVTGESPVTIATTCNNPLQAGT